MILLIGADTAYYHEKPKTAHFVLSFVTGSTQVQLASVCTTGMPFLWMFGALSVLAIIIVTIFIVIIIIVLVSSP